MSISLQTISSDIYRLAEEVWLRLLRLDDNSDREMASDRPSRRLQATRQAPRRAAPCRVHPPPDCLRKLRQTGSVPLVGLVTLRYRLRGSTAGLSFAQPGASPHGAGLSRPQLPGASLRFGAAYPTRVGGRQLNIMLELCAAQKPRCPLRRIICIMCKLPPLF